MLLGLQLVNELIEPVGIDARLEAEGVRLDLEAGRSGWLAAHPETETERVVHDRLQIILMCWVDAVKMHSVREVAALRFRPRRG